MSLASSVVAAEARSHRWVTEGGADGWATDAADAGRGAGVGSAQPVPLASEEPFHAVAQIPANQARILHQLPDAAPLVAAYTASTRLSSRGAATALLFAFSPLVPRKKRVGRGEAKAAAGELAVRAVDLIADVDFRVTAWLSRLCTVQGWATYARRWVMAESAARLPAGASRGAAASGSDVVTAQRDAASALVSSLASQFVAAIQQPSVAKVFSAAGVDVHAADGAEGAVDHADAATRATNTALALGAVLSALPPSATRRLSGIVIDALTEASRIVS